MKKELTITALLVTMSLAVYAGLRLGQPHKGAGEVHKTHLDVETKPRILFHGSSNKEIEVLQPRAEHVRDKEEGAVVFATPNIDVASMWLMSKQPGKVIKGNFNGKSFHFVYNGSKADFMRQDNGGAIYCLSSDGFYFTPSKGMGPNEWVSRETAKPLHIFYFDSALEAMVDFGVQVYFIEDSELFDLLKSLLNKKEFKDFQDRLNQLISENQRQNKNVLPIC